MDNSRINVKPTVDRVKEVIQSVSGVGGQSNTAESNSGYSNSVKPIGSSTMVPQSELLITTTEPVTLSGKPNQPLETYQNNACSCSCSIEDFCGD